MAEQICFESLLQSSECPPLVFHNIINHWPAAAWTPEYLADVMKGKKFSCKIAPRNSGDLLPETECLHLDTTITDYVEWASGKPGADNPMSALDPSRYSCYVDYKYMVDFFSECPHLLKQVYWNCFGLGERDGTDSTIWIGSSGAYTPMHYDTYGFNLVAQIYGRKRWFLFPPHQTPYMYATRIPYEESSVFSQVNVIDPDLKRQPKFKMTTPYVVTLEPRQVLYVPRHWWHFVECIDSAISINTWVPVPEDKGEHVKEAVTRLLACNLTSLVTDIQDSPAVINTNEELTSPEVNFAFLQKSVQELMSSEASDSNKRESTSGSESNLSQSSDHFMKFVEAFRGHSVKVLHRNSHVKNVGGKKRKNICDCNNTTQQDCFGTSCTNVETAIQNRLLDSDTSEETLNTNLSEISESTLKVEDYHPCSGGKADIKSLNEYENSNRDINSVHDPKKQYGPIKRYVDMEESDIKHASLCRYSFRDAEEKMHTEEINSKEELKLGTKNINNVSLHKEHAELTRRLVEIKTVPAYAFIDYIRFLQENYGFSDAEVVQCFMRDHEAELNLEYETDKAKENARNRHLFDSVCKITPIDVIDSVLNPSCVEAICNVLKHRLNIS
ncbi:hypothetical protein CHS0354_019610 [Potamilus streckersoni]|uniref:JmjC domain-containing protein n=1 Tax=Potamilus streckersoni TaxID=2493646 RepID=A0AAE0W922_9BIVA|nr:hypothetical protein CHS0354_019610 [Potamilus streckersoni]